MYWNWNRRKAGMAMHILRRSMGILVIAWAGALPGGWFQAGASAQENLSNSTAVLEIQAPNGSQVFLDSQNYGGRREFSYERLQPGVTYTIQVAVVLPNGTRQTRQVEIQGGQRSREAFAAPNSGGARSAAPPGRPIPLGEAGSQGGNRWALLIAVDDYSTLDDLDYCGQDMQSLARTLADARFPEDHIFLVHDRATDRRNHPLRTNIERQLKTVLKLAEPDDLILVAFSGHGVHVDGKSYLCPAEADLSQPQETMISVESIYKQFRECQAALKLLIVDACRNDPRPAGIRSAATKPDLRKLANSFERPPYGILVLTSCAPGQISREDPQLGHGVFMHYVLKGLQGQADQDAAGNRDGKISLTELFEYSNIKAKSHVARRFNDLQTPTLKGELTGPFYFERGGPRREFQNSLDMTLKLIPAGRFLMGSKDAPATIAQEYQELAENFHNEHPRHLVTITKPFYMAACEVTNAQFQEFVEDTGYRTDAEKDGRGGAGFNPNANTATEDATRGATWKTMKAAGPEHPVVLVSWNDAHAFCQWLSRKEGIRYRLPTEAEWEYACRAGTNTRYWTGESPETLLVGANVPDRAFLRTHTDVRYATIRGDDGFARTSPVGTFRPNPFGLFDTHGNVWEWCSDGYHDDMYDRNITQDPIGPPNDLRVIRGGCFM